MQAEYVYAYKDNYIPDEKFSDKTVRLETYTMGTSLCNMMGNMMLNNYTYINDVRNTMEVLKELDPDNITIHSLAIKRAAKLTIFKDRFKDMQMINTKEHMDLCEKYCKKMGLNPYYLYRQKGMAGNMENVGYAKEGKAGVYNILIMEEKQTIIALGAGASTKLVLKEVNEDGNRKIARVENVKDVKNYLERVDEMIQRKIDKMEEVKWH